MIKSKRTKRRKIKDEVDVIKDLHSNESSGFVEIEKSNDSTKSFEILKTTEIISDIPSSSVKSYNFTSTSNLDITESLPTILNHDEISTSNGNCFVQNDNNSHSPNTLEFIANWAVKFSIPQNAVTGLLRGLKEHECFKNFPVDCRTLLKTPKQISLKIKTVKPGSYYHFGLSSGILRYAPTDLETIKIAIGIDGLPIS